MAKFGFKPFKNETDNLQIGDMTIENRLDRISIYGSLDITRDQEGLKAAKELKAVLDQTLAEMEKADLPAKIVVAEPESVKNPFV